ncbi:MAG TPA: hypothetical protein DCZ05_09075 [Deltaproteobacteria bacterium]|nr:hypothetical protein [Deltaproteobacteria bacterium]
MPPGDAGRYPWPGRYRPCRALRGLLTFTEKIEGHFHLGAPLGKNHFPLVDLGELKSFHRVT